MQRDFPDIPLDLLEALELSFPQRCPDHRMSDREIWIEVGKCKLVEWLRSKFNHQQKRREEARRHVLKDSINA